LLSSSSSNPGTDGGNDAVTKTDSAQKDALPTTDGAQKDVVTTKDALPTQDVVETTDSTPDAKPHKDVVTPPEDSGNDAGTEAGTEAGTDAGGEGGTPSDCAALGLLECQQLQSCAPHVFAEIYGVNGADAGTSLALCQSEAARLCTALPPIYDSESVGADDPVACKTALTGTCDQFLAALDHLPAACLPKPGQKAKDESCLVTAQCGSGLTCYTDGPASCPSYCGARGTAGTPCGNSLPGSDDLCDPYNGLFCVYVSSGGSNLGQVVCSTITRAAAGAACTVQAGGKTDQQCESGLTCVQADAGSPVCTALLQDGTTCTASGIPCDYRIGLICEPTDLANPGGGSTCQGPYVVPDGATCGQVKDGSNTHNHVCDSYSYCDSTGICQPKVEKGAACVNNGCYPPYVCNVGTCQNPTEQTDPTCNPDMTPPASEMVCGNSLGGIPLVCSSGYPCCTSQPGPTDPEALLGTCATGSTCPTTSSAELDCEDSSQCPTNHYCCLSYNTTGTPTLKGACSASACSASGAQKDFELCRTDGANPCGGGSNKCWPASGVSEFNSYLPNDVGFCAPSSTAPACESPSDGCGGDSDCCSDSCDITRDTCN
jgi:hypothetical protein